MGPIHPAISLPLVLAGHPDLESLSWLSASLPACPVHHLEGRSARSGLVWSAPSPPGSWATQKNTGVPRYPRPRAPMDVTHHCSSLRPAWVLPSAAAAAAAAATAKRSAAKHSAAEPSPAQPGGLPVQSELNVVSPISLHNTTCTRLLIFRDHNPLLSAQRCLHPAARSKTLSSRCTRRIENPPLIQSWPRLRDGIVCVPVLIYSTVSTVVLARRHLHDDVRRKPSKPPPYSPSDHCSCCEPRRRANNPAPHPNCLARVASQQAGSQVVVEKFQALQT